MPYRIDIECPPSNAVDLLVQWEALDIDCVGNGLAAILPDSVRHEAVALAFGVPSVAVSAAISRDNGSTWLLSPRATQIGSMLIAPPTEPVLHTTLRLIDSQAFGTGHHATTALCVEAIQEIVSFGRPSAILDVGTGSGILALTALLLGVPQAAGLDLDAGALQAAAENARLNGVADRFQLILGGPGAVTGTWPLVVANVLAAPLIEMAPILVQRLARRGHLILSGIPQSLEAEVRHAYQHCGMQHTGSKTRDGWIVLIEQTSW